MSGWDRREKLDHQRLADFISVKINDAFQPKQEVFFARTARDTTIKLFKKLKEEGVIDWSLTNNTYAKLLKIAEKYKLLHIYENYVAPTMTNDGMKIVSKKGKARLIGPGEGLPVEQGAFLERYEALKNEDEHRRTA